MSENYAVLTDTNKMVVDSFIDFLYAKQEAHEQELLSLLQEYEDGKTVGGFHSVDELMEDLYA